MKKENVFPKTVLSSSQNVCYPYKSPRGGKGLIQKAGQWWVWQELQMCKEYLK